MFCGLMSGKYSFFVTSCITANIIPTINHAGGYVMVWRCFPEGPGWLAISNRTMKSAALYQKILKEYVHSSVDLKLKHNWNMTTIWNTKASPTLNSSRNKIKILEKPAKVLMWTPLGCCGRILKWAISCLKSFHCVKMKAIQQRVGQNSSTAMWKTDVQLSEAFFCRYCC